MTIDFTTLFTQIGKAINTAEELVDSYNDTIEPSVRAFQDELESETHTIQDAVTGNIESGLSSLRSSTSSAISSLAGTPVSNLIVETVHADQPLLSKNIGNALDVLIDQMSDNSESLDASTIDAEVDYGRGASSSSSGYAGDNTGNGVIVVCTQRGDGRVNEFILSETIRGTITSTSSDGSATWKLEGEPTQTVASPLWPGGSGTSRSISSRVASGSNLVSNGTFETEDTVADYLPDGWILSVGTLGTTILITDIEQQTVTINGTPTGGFYTLSFTDNESRTYTTEPLAYNAGSSDVQTALQSLPFLGSATVSSTGTSPNYTHTITFYSVANPSALTYTSSLTGGTPTITVATPTPGSNAIHRGARALEFNGDGADLTTIQTEVTLAAKTCYCLNFWALCDVAPAAGELTVDLVDGIAGTVVQDDQGNNNTLAVDLTALGTYPTPQNVCFHTPTAMPPLIYLRFRLTTALSNTTSLFLDEVSMVQMTELYTSGLYAAAFSGPTDFVAGDGATITIVNNREGLLHEWLNRLLNLSGQKLMLPTASTGTQTDALIT